MNNTFAQLHVSTNSPIDSGSSGRPVDGGGGGR